MPRRMRICGPSSSTAISAICSQNEITSRIAIALNLELTSREATRSTEQPDALDYLLRGRAAYWDWQGARSRDRFAETTRLFERPLALDPRSVEAKSWVAFMLYLREESVLPPFMG